MSDLIDRESAIVRACAVIKDDYVAYDVVQALKALPSAQPEKRTEERTKTHACDSISRQDTVDVIASMIAYHKTLDDAYWYVKSDAPSAQPESCEGCKWENAFGYGECGRCRRRLEDMYERGTCENE